MDSMVTPSNYGPGFVADGRNDGPSWAALGPSDAALSTHLAVKSNADVTSVNAQFVRDAIERNAHATDIRRDFADIKNYLATLDPQKAILQLEVSRLKSDAEASKFDAILAAIKDLKKV